MPAPTSTTPRDRVAIAIASVVATLSVIASTLLAFAADGRTEWLAAAPDLAIAAHRCDNASGSAQGHGCPREVADAQRPTNVAATRRAKR